MIAIYQKGIDKELRTSIISDTLAKVENGEIDPIELQISLKNIETICSAIKENKAFKEAVLNDVQNNGKGYEYSNAKIETRELGVKYSYVNCNDAELTKLELLFDVANKNLKERQEFLKGVPGKGIDVTDEETGEITTIYPPSKSSTTGTVITLK